MMFSRRARLPNAGEGFQQVHKGAENIRSVSTYCSRKYCSKCFAKYEAIQFSTLMQRAFDYYHLYFEDGELRG